MKSFRELRVWQQAMKLVEMIHRSRRDFQDMKPTVDESTSTGPSFRFHQILRKSIPANTCESIFIAQASLAEVESQVELATRLAYVQPSELKKILGEINSLGRQLYALRNSLRTRLN